MRAALAMAQGGAAQAAAVLPAGLGDDRGVRLWAGSWAAMLTLHVGALAVAVLWAPSTEMAAPPPAAIMLELAPAAAPAAPPSEKAPGVQEDAARPLERKIEEEVKPPPVKKAEVALPKPKPRPKPAPKVVEEAPPAEKVVERTTAPQAAEAPPAPQMAAPAPGAASSVPSNAVPTWQGTLRAHLERHKRYPSAAQFRRQQGVAHVRFAMDRDGRVLWARLERGSGHDRLDDESLALMERAQPLPPPPPEVTGNPIEIVVPIQFFLK